MNRIRKIIQEALIPLNMNIGTIMVLLRAYDENMKSTAYPSASEKSWRRKVQNSLDKHVRDYGYDTILNAFDDEKYANLFKLYVKK